MDFLLIGFVVVLVVLGVVGYLHRERYNEDGKYRADNDKNWGG